MQLSIFDDIVTEIPETQGIKYAGSKMRLLPYILNAAKKVNPKSVMDCFSGTTRVSQAFAKTGHLVKCNDRAIWSKIFGECYLLNKYNKAHYEKIIDHLNSLPPTEGWFTEMYSGIDMDGSAIQKNGKKALWQKHNTAKLDAIRPEIDRLGLSGIERSVILTSLILALDKIDNTMGHYVSYLKDWSPRSYNRLTLEVPDLYVDDNNHIVSHGDVFDFISNNSADLAYLDPPYGSNNEKMPPSRVRYASYYHIWSTVILNDKPELFGSVNRRVDSRDDVCGSLFEEYRKNHNGRFIAVEAIERLIKEIKAKYILLSYSSGGRATAQELNDVFSASGEIIQFEKIDYKKNVMANMKWTNEWLRENDDQENKEYLILIKMKGS